MFRLILTIISIILFTNIPAYLGYSGYGVSTFYIFAFIYALIYYFIYSRNRRLGIFVLLWIIFFMYLDISSYLNYSDSLSLINNLIQHFIFIVSLIVFSLVIGYTGFANYARYLVVSFFLLAFGLYITDSYIGAVGGRYSLTYVNPNNLGEAAVILSLIIFKTDKKVYLLPLGLIIIASLSRSAILIFTILFIYSFRSSIVKSFQILAVILALVLLLQPYVYSYLTDNELKVVETRVESILNFNGDESSSERTSVLREYSSSIINGNLLLGNGSRVIDTKRSIRSHNMFIELLYTNGIIGLLLFVAIMYFIRIKGIYLATILLLCSFSHNILESGYTALVFILGNENFSIRHRL